MKVTRHQSVRLPYEMRHILSALAHTINVLQIQIHKFVYLLTPPPPNILTTTDGGQGSAVVSVVVGLPQTHKA